MTENALDYDSMMTPEVIDKAKMLGSRLTSSEKDKEKTAISWLFLTDIIKTKIRVTIQGKEKLLISFPFFFLYYQLQLKYCNVLYIFKLKW